MTDGIRLNFDLKGFKDQLSQFGAKFEKSAVTSATVEAAKVFKKAVIPLVPVLGRSTNQRKRGALKRAIYVFRVKGTKRGIVRYAVSFRKGGKATGTKRDAFYGRYLEKGWLPRGRGNAIKGGTRSRTFKRKQIVSKGKGKIISYPFLKPGFVQAGSAALDVFTKRLQEQIARYSKFLKTVGR